MTAPDLTAPITQDVLTLPRKLPEGGLTNIIGLTRDQLREALVAAGTPEKQAKMRLGQVWQWVYHWGVRDFAAMTNLAKDYRALLAQHFVIKLPQLVTRQISADGTRKYLVRQWAMVGTNRGFIALWDLRFHQIMKLWHHSRSSPINRLATSFVPLLNRGWESRHQVLQSFRNHFCSWQVAQMNVQCLT